MKGYKESSEPKKIMNVNSRASSLSLMGGILPNHEEAKRSTKRNGIIRGYAVNTNQGIYRTYNEDRVSIILNISKP